MGLFRHPHLTRGTVYTPKGAFVILRGIVEVPDDIGESYGWEQIDEEELSVSTPASEIAASRSRRQMRATAVESHTR